MTNELWVQLVIGLISNTIPIVGLAFWMDRRLTLIDSRLESMIRLLDAAGDRLKDYGPLEPVTDPKKEQ